MKLLRRQFLHLAAGAAVIPVMTPKASAQTYLTRAISRRRPPRVAGISDCGQNPRALSSAQYSPRASRSV
jgi:hypothetical protein